MKESLQSISGFNPLVVKNNIQNWIDAVNNGDIKQLLSLYHDEADFIPTFSRDIKKGKKGAESYFKEFLLKKPKCKLLENKVKKLADKTYYHIGNYKFTIINDSVEKVVDARFTFIWNDDKIIQHHSSVMP